VSERSKKSRLPEGIRKERLRRLSFAIGVVGAGVAVALQDVVASIAGAFSIGFSKLYARETECRSATREAT
jgi:hypothetical protein